MRSRMLSWIFVAAGFFSLAAPTARAQGVVVKRLAEPQILFSDLFTVLYPVDLNGDSVVDFSFGAEWQGIALRTERANRLMFRIDPPPNLGGPVARLAEGFVIGSSLEAQVAWRSSDLRGGYVSPGEIAFVTIVQCLDIGCLSTWPPGPATRGFIGIEFELSDGLHYGYFDIVLSGDAAGAALLGWAYETRANTPILAGAGIDSDHDGVWDSLDRCPDTPAGTVVDTNGCCITQLAPCDGPWKNHGEFVKAIEKVASRFVEEKRITPSKKSAVLKQAAASDCGKSK